MFQLNYHGDYHLCEKVGAGVAQDSWGWKVWGGVSILPCWFFIAQLIPAAKTSFAASYQPDLGSSIWPGACRRARCLAYLLCALTLVVHSPFCLFQNPWIPKAEFTPNKQLGMLWFYSATSNIYPHRNTAIHRGLISHCTAVNDSMWRRAQSLKIWLLWNTRVS